MDCFLDSGGGFDAPLVDRTTSLCFAFCRFRNGVARDGFMTILKLLHLCCRNLISYDTHHFVTYSRSARGCNCHVDDFLPSGVYYSSRAFSIRVLLYIQIVWIYDVITVGGGHYHPHTFILCRLDSSYECAV